MGTRAVFRSEERAALFARQFRGSCDVAIRELATQSGPAFLVDIQPRG